MTTLSNLFYEFIFSFFGVAKMKAFFTIEFLNNEKLDCPIYCLRQTSFILGVPYIILQLR